MHGTMRTRRTGCDCVRCREAERRIASHRSSREKRLAERVDVKGRLFHPQAPHGTENGYGYYGCRCDDCTQVTSEAAMARASGRR
jgi:hypothetical protein